MAVLYTDREIQKALRDLHIRPEDGKVTGQEATKILSWRAKHEQGIEHEYLSSAIRRHVSQGNLTPHPVNIRFNMYKTEDVFEVPLVPKRGLKKSNENTIQTLSP